MEEIIDLEEIEKEVTPESLKEFMKKDEETEKLLNDKIDELAKEEDKINKKEEELRSLEEKSREKISTNASADELIEIAGKIKEVEEELSSIKENIQTLIIEKEELVNTRNEVEKSKREYIKLLNETNSTFEEQLKKISEAIEVCDNPTLKQVLEDVRSKKDEQLDILQQKRINELKTVLKEETEEVEPKIELTSDVKVETPKIEVPKVKEEIKIDEPVVTPKFDIPVVESEPKVNDEIKFDIPTLESEPEVNNEMKFEIPTLDDQIVVPNIEQSQFDIPVVENKTKETNSDVINLDDILNNINANQELNIVPQDNIQIPKVNSIDDNKIRIIYEKEVPNNLVKEIYSSSKIMPCLYDYLDNKNVNEGSFN